MSTLVVVVVVGALIAFGALLGRSLLRLRGKRLVQCPETRAPASVELDLRYAAVGAAVNRPVLKLRSCSHWPERCRCGEPCLDEIESAPEDCLVRNILARWCQGRQCVYCHARFGDIHWHDHKPALLAPGGGLVEWSQVPAE